MEGRKVLLLDQNYLPISIVTWRRAVGLVIGRNKAHILEEYQEKKNSQFDVAVIRLLVKSPNPFSLWERQKFSKKSLYLRDKRECQYCGVYLSFDTATMDHVIPRSKGGKTSYDNCVISCKDCNESKGNKTPEEASMPVRGVLRKPNMLDIFTWHPSVPSEWKTYLSY